MNRLLPKAQAGLLAAGTAFSWFTLVRDYRRFFAAGGRVFELSGCIVQNPLSTPCFYGALAFLAAFVWSILILRSAPQAIRGQQAGLTWLLAAGTVFAWGNFAYEVYRFYGAPKAALPLSCPPGESAVHPLLAPCFYGALIFFGALVVSVLIVRPLQARSAPA
jgi:hypothetical protein